MPALASHSMCIWWSWPCVRGPGGLLASPPWLSGWNAEDAGYEAYSWSGLPSCGWLARMDSMPGRGTIPRPTQEMIEHWLSWEPYIEHFDSYLLQDEKEGFNSMFRVLSTILHKASWSKPLHLHYLGLLICKLITKPLLNFKLIAKS